MRGEIAIPVSGILVYNFPETRPDDFEVLVVDSITHFGKVSLLGGKAESRENPRACALREMEQESGLRPKSKKDLALAFASACLVRNDEGLFAFSLFCCDFARTNKRLEIPEAERNKLFNLRFVPSKVFYNLVLLGKIDIVVLGGIWEDMVRQELSQRRSSRQGQ